VIVKGRTAGKNGGVGGLLKDQLKEKEWVHPKNTQGESSFHDATRRKGLCNKQWELRGLRGKVAEFLLNKRHGGGLGQGSSIR